MKVLYDSHVFDRCRFGGISQYYAKIWSNFGDEIKPQLSILESENLHLRECGFAFPEPRRTFRAFLPNVSFRGKHCLYRFLGRLFPFAFSGSERLNECNFKRLVSKGDYDLIHLTGVHGNEWVFEKCIRIHKPVIVTCFDLIPELYHGDKTIQREHSYAYTMATHIIAISENTKKDLCNFYNVSEDRVSVVYLGGNMQPVAKTEFDNFVGDDRYILYVGNRAGYKNFTFFARAIAQIVKDSSLKVFCTGLAFSKTELDLLEQLGVRSKFIQNFVSDEQLRNLYHYALAFVYPSLHEGFGIPILDAFAGGCPTLLSNATCFPEVGGDAALYFNPKDENDFRRQLMRVIGSDEESRKLRADLVARGRERVKMFTWKKCAEDTAAVYQNVVKCFGR